MKRRSAFVVPGLAAVLAAAIAVLVGPFTSPTTQAASSLTFNATFDTSADFYGRFDYGFSGIDPRATPGTNGVHSFHGDHNANCEGPTTDRTVNYTDDFSQVFWHCAPGGDGTKGHVMTGVDTLGYNTAWFTPKPMFEKVSQVCWDINATQMSSRKWTQVLFVSEADATRYPSSKGSGGFDLGYTSPEFRQDAPNNGIFPQGGTLAGLKVMLGTFQWFDHQDNFASVNGDTFVGWPGFNAGADKAARFKHCIINKPNNKVTVTEQTPNGLRSFDIPGQIPQGNVKVVFEDDNYDPVKDDRYNASVLTWHWDNIQVFTDSDAPATTTTPPSTTPPTTTPPSTTPPTTTPPTTTPPTTTPPTTTPPTTTPPTTTPPTTTPPTTEPPTTEPPTTEPPTTEPPTTEPPTTEPPTTEPPTTAPPTTEPPTTEPPTTAPPTTAPPGEPGGPLVIITSGPDEMTTDPDAEITFEVQSTQRTERLRALDRTLVLCRLDGQRPRLCNSPVRYKHLGLGEHEVVITAYQWRGGSLLASRPFTTGSARHSWTVVDEATLDQASAAPSPDSGVLASEATSSGTPSVQRTVLSFTGSHSTQIAVFGLMLIALGVALGSVSTVARRRSD